MDGSPPRSIRLSTHGKLVAAALLVGLAILLLRTIGPVLAPFIAAIITAYLFNPLVSWLDRRSRIHRAVWIGVLYVIIFSLLFLLGTWVWPRITYQYGEIVAQLPRLMDFVAEQFEGHDTVELGAGLTFDLTTLEEHFIGMISDLGRALSGGVPHLVFSALEIVIYTLVYLIITFYLLLQSYELKMWAVNLIPPPYRVEICGLGHQIDQVLGAYIRGQLLLVVIMSVLLYIPLSILQVPYALVIAITSGVLELIPLLGPWSAAGIAMTVVFFQPEVPFGFSNVGLAVLVGFIYFTLRQIEDSFIIPNVVGPLVKLHPGVVIFAILAGGSIAGPFGLLISIPTAAVIRILLTYLYRKLVDAPDVTPPPPPITEPEPSHTPPRAKEEHSSARLHQECES